MSRRGRGLDPRAWLLWMLAASLPALVGRNPFVLGATLLAAIGVRAAWEGVAPRARSWRGVLRLAVVFALVGVLFNVLTYHGGDTVLARLPDAIPIVGGPLTLNALVYGLLSGVALLTLVLVGTTVAALLDWAAALRLLPERLATVAVAGSVAFAFVPQTAAAFGEIREAQAARGHRLRGARDLVPLLAPLLTNGLERAITLAEALESRAFGAPVGPARARPWHGPASTVALTGAVSSGYLLAVGQSLLGMLILGAATALLALVVRGGRPVVGRTRYRPPRWGRADALVAGGAIVAAGAVVVTLARNPAALRYEPYPSLAAPVVDLVLLLALAALLVPAFVVPPAAADGGEGGPPPTAGRPIGCLPPSGGGDDR